jgi:hypothetical protein
MGAVQTPHWGGRCYLSVQSLSMITSLFIIAFSLPLFILWFHSICTLIVRSTQTGDCPLGATIRLSFSQAQEKLTTDSPILLHEFYEVLLTDHLVLTDLLDGLAGPSSTTKRLLAVDFRILKIWYSLNRYTSLRLTRSALSDMSGILNLFAVEIGYRAAAYTDDREFA